MLDEEAKLQIYAAKVRDDQNHSDCSTALDSDCHDRETLIFTDTVRGNPKAEVEVRAAPDGTIVGKRLVRSSGVKEWDDAVLRALDKTESLPRDTDGRVPSPVVIEFRPHV